MDEERVDSLSLGSVGTFCKETTVEDHEVQPVEMSSTEKEGPIDHKGPSPCETQMPDPTVHTEPIVKMEKPCKFFFSLFRHFSEVSL